MTLRDRLLAKLSESDYRPANNFILGRLLGLNKKHSAALASEIRQLVKTREIRLGEGGRVELNSRPTGKPKAELKERFKAHVQNQKVEARPIFQPTPRVGFTPVAPTEVFNAKPTAPAPRPAGARAGRPSWRRTIRCRWA